MSSKYQLFKEKWKESVPSLDAIHNFLWERPDPQYTLHLSMAIKQSTLSAMRLVFGIYQVLLTIIAPIYALYPGRLTAYMTHWGCFFCTLYFICINIVTLVPNPLTNESKWFRYFWKFTHIVFEIAFSMEFLIFVFFWCFIFPVAYNYTFDNSFQVIINMTLHAITPSCIAIENFFNFIKFYKRHFWVVAMILFFYSINNCIWTLTTFEIYPLVTWTDPLTYFLMLIALGLCILGFWVGIKIYEYKETLAVIEVDVPSNEPLIINNEVVKQPEDLEQQKNDKIQESEIA